MMTFVNTAPQSLTAPLSAWINARIAGYKEAARRHAVYTQTLSELKAMSDREYADLGISPMSIYELARQAADQA